jgi:hypothetical protein
MKKKGLKIKYVDGYKIRQTLDPDFNIIHYNNPKSGAFESKFYIPRDEIWVDRRFKDEISLKRKRGRRPKNFVIKTEKRNGLKIEYVDGRMIREYIDPEFVMGGHDLVYKYIPPKTIWIDNRLDPRDIPHILVHELYERKLMSQGKNYDNAHDYATAAEKESRRKAGGKYIGDSK